MKNALPGRLITILALSLAGYVPLRAADPSLPAYLPKEVSGTLVTTGPDTMENLMKAWVAGFNKLHAGAPLSFVLKECAPEDRVTAGPNVDEAYANSSAKYSDRYGYEPFRVRVSMGGLDTPAHINALGVFVHLSNPLNQISLAQLDAVYSDERRRGYPSDIRTWGDLGLTGEWANKPVHPIGRGLKNEVAWHFKDRVTLNGLYKAAYIQPGKGISVDVMAAIANDPSGIAYCGLAYKTDKVKVLALVDGSHVSSPNRAEVSSGRYPLDRPLYIYINRAPGTPLDPLAKEFFTFILSKEGQEMGAVDGMLPLPASYAVAERAKLE